MLEVDIVFLILQSTGILGFCSYSWLVLQFLEMSSVITLTISEYTQMSYAYKHTHTSE